MSAAEAENTRRASAELVELLQKERSRIAFDIHDGPAQSISAALLHVRLLKSESPEEVLAGLDDLETQLIGALEVIYSAMEQLRSRALDCEGLVSKVEALLSEFSAKTGIAVEVSLDGDGSELSDSMQIALFQIIQEALQNVRRHAQAKRVTATLDIRHDRVFCQVIDDGKGFDPESVPIADRRGFGLAGMRERARLLGGECCVLSQPGEGCCVAVDIPIWRG